MLTVLLPQVGHVDEGHATRVKAEEEKVAGLPQGAVPGEGQVNLIFDMVIPIEYDEKMRKELPQRLAERVKEIDPRYQCVITVDYDYVAKTTEE